jgi:menaquinone-dependent protoporphyrinogen oxidase
MTKTLIVYGTRYGATASTSGEIAEVLRKEGIEVRVVDAKEEKVKDIGGYDLVIVGSGIQMGKWTSEPESFLRKYQNELSRKKLAIFVSCGSANPLSEGEQEMDEGKRRYLDEKATKYNLKPVALGFFGGCYDFNKMPWLLRKTLSSIKPKLEGAGYKESKTGVYDLRDLNEIRNWAKELAKTVSS